MKAGALLQLLSLETGLGCNLSPLHPQCPNALGSDRYAALPQTHRLTPESIVDIVRTFHDDFDFRGWVGFSFYNEPMLDVNGLLKTVHAVHEATPTLKLMLTTNGTRLPEDVTPLGVFAWIGITDYGGSSSPDPARVARLTALIGEGRMTPEPRGVFVNPGRLDGRLHGQGADRGHKSCRYPFQDMAIDYFGNAHLCCFDWRGQANLGNVLREGVGPVLGYWTRVLRQITGETMTPDAPACCRYCRHPNFQRVPLLDEMAHGRAVAWLEQHR